MADIFFLLAGLVLLFKKEVHISRKRVLSGRIVKILAVLYVLPFTVSFIVGIIITAVGADPMNSIWISIPFTVVAILTTLYFIFFYKEHANGR